MVVGHPQMDAPAYGWIDGLRRTGDRLQAKLRDIDPAFREAVEAGRYAGRSVALENDVTDGYRLQHLGFLGGAAPAVKGLAPTQFSATPAHTYRFAASDMESWGWAALARLLRRLREWLIEKKGVERADGLIADWEIEQVNDAKARSDAPATAFAAADDDAAAQAAPAQEGTNKEGEMPDDDKKMAAADAAAREALEAERETLEAERKALQAEHAAFAEAERRRTAETELAAHVAAGRVLPAEQDGLAAFMAGLSNDDGAIFTFAAGDGGAEREATPLAYFSGFLDRLPQRVPYGEITGASDAPVNTNDAGAVAREARTLMAADKTGGLTIDRAVRQITGDGKE